MKGLKSNLDFALVAVVIGGFVLVASQRLGAVPVPEGDEAYMAQVSYEMLYHHKIAVPMMRYLGGNIENAWHCRTPVYFFLMAGFHKLFGYGLAQGRAFNLMTAALTLLMVYLIGRRLVDWRAGLVAVILLAGDQVFLERSRLLRNDFAGAAFALLALYLYEIAQQRRSLKYYVASGLAAGAGVMCHTNVLYMVGAICVLILLRGGWRVFSSKNLYVFAGSALVVMAYEIAYAIADYQTFSMQNRGDEVHFRVLTRGGLWQNLVEERLRYLKWYAGGTVVPGLPQTMLRIFQLLTIVAIIYLVIVCVQKIKRGNVLNDPRVRVLLVTAAVVLFHTFIVSHKRVFYLVHILPWFALSIGVMLRDGMERIGRLRTARWPHARLAYRAVVGLVLLAALGCAFEFVSEGRRYLVEVRDPNLASFEEFTATMRDIVPEGLCPIAVKNPSIWLAFPEKDGCFASIENRTIEDAYAEIDGKDYALVTRLNALPEKLNPDSNEGRSRAYHLLGEMRDTPYGNLMIYYTGADSRYLALAPKRYQFFGDLRGHVSIGQEKMRY